MLLRMEWAELEVMRAGVFVRLGRWEAWAEGARGSAWGAWRDEKGAEVVGLGLRARVDLAAS